MIPLVVYAIYYLFNGNYLSNAFGSFISFLKEGIEGTFAELYNPSSANELTIVAVVALIVLLLILLYFFCNGKDISGLNFPVSDVLQDAHYSTLFYILLPVPFFAAIYLFIMSQLSDKYPYLLIYMKLVLTFTLIAFMVLWRELKLAMKMTDPSMKLLSYLTIVYFGCRMVNHYTIQEEDFLQFLILFICDFKKLYSENDAYLEFFIGKLMFLLGYLLKREDIPSPSFILPLYLEVLIDLCTIYFA